MPLTTAQLQTFKAAINAEPALAAARAAGDHGAIAAYYNVVSASNIWKPAVTVADLNTAIVWTEFISLAQGARDAYFAMTQGSTVDATKANVRNGFAAIFAGTSQSNLTALAQRLATRFEVLFTVAQVCSLFGYVVSVADVAEALGS